MELEAASADRTLDGYPFPIVEGPLLELDPRPLIAAIVHDLALGADLATIGGRFHRALADAIAVACEALRKRHGLGSVALSGGCFQSRLLTTLTVERLARDGFEVLLHSRVPPNDGGIALGQAAVAAWRNREP
jgi:hydrogenase maturation protein HypF